MKRHCKTISLIFRLCTNLLPTDVNKKCKKLCVTEIVSRSKRTIKLLNRKMIKL